MEKPERLTLLTSEEEEFVEAIFEDSDEILMEGSSEQVSFSEKFTNKENAGVLIKLRQRLKVEEGLLEERYKTFYQRYQSLKKRREFTDEQLLIMIKLYGQTSKSGSKFIDTGMFKATRIQSISSRVDPTYLAPEETTYKFEIEFDDMNEAALFRDSFPTAKEEWLPKKEVTDPKLKALKEIAKSLDKDTTEGAFTAIAGAYIKIT